jgi:hypothetical protein
VERSRVLHQTDLVEMLGGDQPGSCGEMRCVEVAFAHQADATRFGMPLKQQLVDPVMRMDEENAHQPLSANAEIGPQSECE